MQYQEWIGNIKNLTPNDFQKAEGEAETLVRRDIGDKPSRKDFHREQEPFDIMFLLRLVVLFFGLMISIVEGVKFVGIQANFVVLSSEEFSYGMQMNKNLFVFVLQISYVFLAEFGMISNMMTWSKKIKTTGLGNRKYIKFLDYHLLLSILSMSFILLVNFSSGMHPLLALMPALIVIGLGYDFETFFSKITIEVERVTREYNGYTKEWNDINLEPEKHPDYQTYLMRSVWKYLSQRNKLQYEDVSGDWKFLAVQRELENVNWAKYGNMKKRLADQTDETVESIGDKPAIQVLRESMDFWKVGDDPIIRVESYSVDMNKLTFTNHSTGLVKKAKRVQGLKKMVQTVVKGVG